MRHTTPPLIDEWPTVRFDDLEHMNVDNKCIGFFCRAIWMFLIFPQTIVAAFVIVLRFNPK